MENGKDWVGGVEKGERGREEGLKKGSRENEIVEGAKKRKAGRVKKGREGW